jgi:hypothetical protein
LPPELDDRFVIRKPTLAPTILNGWFGSILVLEITEIER